MTLLEVESKIYPVETRHRLTFEDGRMMLLAGGSPNGRANIMGPDRRRYWRFAILEQLDGKLDYCEDRAFHRRLRTTFKDAVVTRSGWVRFYENDMVLLKLMAA